MSTYVYNSTISTNTYVTEDYGSISSSVDVDVDYSAGLSLPAQTVVDYTTYFYLPHTDFSSTVKTFDDNKNFSSTNINFSSTTPINQVETFDSTTYENFGNIYDNSTITPFGNISTSGVLTGEAITFHYTAPQATLPIAGNALSSLVKFWVGSGTLFEIGSGLERTVKPYVSSGTLRFRPGAFGTRADNDYDTCDSEITCDIGGISALESITNAYNTSSIYNPDLDYGSVASYVLGGNDLGLITQQDPGHFPYDDFGSILDAPIIYPSLPFGQITFVSSAVPLSFTANTPDQTILYGFSGTALEAFSANTPDNTQLFTIFGELVHPFIDYTPHYGIDQNIGVGTTGIKFGSRVFPEKFVFSYNENSPCYDSVAESVDFGLLTGTPIVPITLPNTDFLDYGLVSEEETGNIPDNFGWITEPLITICPFGSIYLSGSLVEKNTDAYVGIGTATFSGTGLESFSAQTPEDTQLFSISGSLVEKNTESYVGVGTVIFSETALESFSANTPEDTQLFSISGIALESFSAQTPEDTQLFSISGSLVEKNTESYVGVGTHLFDVGIFSVPLTTDDDDVTFDSDYIYFDATELRYDAIVSFTARPPVNTQLFSISGTSLESFSANTPEDTQLFSISGIALESFSAQTPEDTQLFSISGTSLESFSAQTPEDTQLFSISGIALESFSAQTPEDTQLFSISGIALESFSAQTPEDTILYTFSGSLVEKNAESYVGFGSFGPVPGVGFAPDGDGNLRDAKTYSNRYGFQIGDFNLGSGIGTIRINGIARTRLALPYFAQGSIFISDGLAESFSKANYNGSGISTISGISSTREINVYGYYGDDNNPGTSGTIFISQQTTPSIERNTESYVGSGQLTASGDSNIVIRNSFLGLGIVQFSGTGLESFSAQSPEDIQLFNISGSSLEVYSAQTPETEVLYVINGFIEESITNSYEGSGLTNLSGNSTTFYVPNYPARGTLRFVHHNADNDYDTCDNEEITCDNQDSANVSFTANPPENTVLFNFDGTAVTTEIAVYTGTGSGLYTISGTYERVRFAYSEVGIGTIFIADISSQTETDVYVGSGTLFAISGASESYSAQTPENTQLFQISGSAVTSVEFDYPVVGIGLFTLSGSAITSEIATYTQIGSGTITLSGELLYPNVVYIPSPDGSGTINVLGSSNNSLTKTYDGIAGSLFGFSSGLESFTKSTYIGVGTIYIQQLSGSTINNPFQIPRTYVVII
jgi:hypothetical protein